MATTRTEDAKVPEVLFVKDVMRLRRMSRELVMRAIRSGELRCEEHGEGKNRYRIDRADYERWRRNRRVGAF